MPRARSGRGRFHAVSADLVVGGVLKLAAIMVGAGDHTFNIALPITEWLELTRNASCP